MCVAFERLRMFEPPWWWRGAGVGLSWWLTGEVCTGLGATEEWFSSSVGCEMRLNAWNACSSGR